MTAYVEATLRLRPAGADGAYPVEIELDDGARFEDGRLTLDPIALKAAQQNAAEYGRLLFAAVFTGGVRDAYLAAGARAQAQTAGRLRVRLRIDARAAELHALAWERLYHPSRGQSAPLATAVDTPFSRYTSLAIADFQPVSERPLRMLVAVANPANLAQLGLTPVDLEAELETVRQAVEPLTQAGKLVVTLLPGGAGLPPALAQKLTAARWELAAGATTLEAIKRRLPGQHIFHFIGHGALARGSAQGEGTAALYLENDAGQSERVPDSELDATLKALGNQLPHLIFLVACESAKREIAALAAAEHPFIGLGPKLVQAGVPAVVAMQDKMPIDTARALTGEFYRRLAEHGEVDRAMAQARLVVFRPNRADWAIPVLFSRLADGVLFAQAPQPAPDAAPTAAGSGGAREGGVVFNVQGNVAVGGDVVGRDKIVTGGDGPANPWAVLESQLKKARKTVDALTLDDPDDKDVLKDLIEKIEENVKENDLANLERRLAKIGKTSPEALAAVVKALTNIAAKVPEPAQAVARKFQA